ncbi:DUF669 domain-containing protein [Rouxiella sp. WC2420]|uniref:DUF669 domain-containing protein n=1 Tax=Rouxiella sp. WC2420 TaxID=3234145 RepID=A0AB39VMK0_9GAMM
MSNVIFTYNQEQALSAGQSGFINESGAYIFTITEAKCMTSSGGAKSIELSVEADDGRKANYLNVYTEKKDKTPNQFGINMINAIMGCTSVNSLTMVMKDINTHLVPELIGKRVGFVLQKTLKSKQDGSDTYNFDIRIPFIAQTNQTLQEKIDGKPAETIAKIASTLKDKDERKRGNNHQPQHSGGYPGDDQFFNQYDNI